MNFQYEWSDVALSDIHCSDTRFQITTAKATDDLLPSLVDIGLINQPLLLEKDSGYLVVTGFRRLSACLDLGWKNIIAKKIVGATDAVCAKLAISDNALQRPLNLIEQSRAIHLLDIYFENQTELLKAAGACHLPAGAKMVEKLKRIYQCPPYIQNALLEETITMNVALELQEMLEGKEEVLTDVIEQLVDLFAALKLGLNKQREVLVLLKEIVLREEISMQRLFSEPILQAIINDTEIDRGHKTHKIRAFLKERRYPELSAAKNNYNRCVKQLQLPQQVKLIPPKDFEGVKYSLSLNFKDHEELVNRKQVLERLASHPAMLEILNS